MPTNPSLINYKKKGANFYLVKPNSFEKLKYLLTKSLEYIYLAKDITDFPEFVISEEKTGIQSSFVF